MTEKKFLSNNFHLIRLIAAIFVIISHSYTLTGLPEHDVMWEFTGKHFSFSYIGLSVFFIISGYLITQSAHPDKPMNLKPALSFLWKRFLRIFPALIVVVLLSIFVLGPNLTTLGSEKYYASSTTWDYLNTMSLYGVKYDLPGVFNDNPYPNAVNGAIWTLSYEFTLYIVILILAVFRILKLRYLVLASYVLALYVIGTLPVHSPPWQIPYLNMDAYVFARFALYFLSGTVLFLFKDKVTLKWWLFFPLAFALIAIWNFLPGYELFATYLLLPIIIMYLANHKSPINTFASVGDFSYGMYIYAFPVQQTLVHFYGRLPVEQMAVFTIVATFPFAFLSWHLIEKKALALKSRTASVK